jgi:hypothetical protein
MENLTPDAVMDMLSRHADFFGSGASAASMQAEALTSGTASIHKGMLEADVEAVVGRCVEVQRGKEGSLDVSPPPISQEETWWKGCSWKASWCGTPSVPNGFLSPRTPKTSLRVTISLRAFRIAAGENEIRSVLPRAQSEISRCRSKWQDRDTATHARAIACPYPTPKTRTAVHENWSPPCEDGEISRSLGRGGCGRG